MAKILLVGNANTGKTTLLNSLTKGSEHTGNWHGVTVEEKVRSFVYKSTKYDIVDLPGIYSLTPFSFEENVSTDYIFSHQANLVLNTCDVNNLHRNLYLTLELLCAGLNVVLAINTMGKKNEIDTYSLEKTLGIKVIKLNFSKPKEMQSLKDVLYEEIQKSNTIETIKKRQALWSKKIFAGDVYNEIESINNQTQLGYFLSLKLIEKDSKLFKENKEIKSQNNNKKCSGCSACIYKNKCNKKQNKLNKKVKYLIKEKRRNLRNIKVKLAFQCKNNHLNFNIDKEKKININKSKNFIFNYLKNENKIDFKDTSKQKYNFISKLIKYEKRKRVYGEEVLDKIFLNKFFAIPIFLAIMLAIFYITFFSVGAWLSDGLSYLVQELVGGALINWFQGFCNIAWLNGLIEYGIIGGVGSLVSFLPQVVFLFLFLAILEDTGYFSRIAFCFEDIFNKIGLSGKSIYTLLMGFGCSASAVLTARNMDNKNAKIKTAILTPYMSCSAKLPIYAVLGGAFFGAGNVFIVFMLYLLGIFVSLFVSVLLDKIGLRTEKSVFILEFPAYRFSSPKRIASLVWLNMKLFLIKVTTIFISMTVIVWCLSSFDFGFNYIVETGGKSMLQTLGELLCPLFTPLGFDNWGAVSALLAGIVAKEIVVSSIAIFNGLHNANPSPSQISGSLLDPSSAVTFTSASALSFMSFCLLYCPCLATLATLKKEIGTKWTVIASLIQVVVAYGVAFVVFNVYNLLINLGLLLTILISVFIFVILLAGLIAASQILNYFKNKRFKSVKI